MCACMVVLVNHAIACCTMNDLVMLCASGASQPCLTMMHAYADKIFSCYSEVPQFHRTHNSWLQGHASADSEDSDSSHPQSPDAAHEAGSVSTLILQSCNCADAELDSDACTHSIILTVLCDAWHTCEAHCKCQLSFFTTFYLTQLLTIRLMACTHSKKNSHVCTHNITCAFSGRLPGHPSMQAYQFCNTVC